MTAGLIVEQTGPPEPECPDCGGVVAPLVVSVPVPDSDTSHSWELVMVCTGCRTEVQP